MSYPDSDLDFYERTSLTEEETEQDPILSTPEGMGMERLDVVEAIEDEMEAV